MESLAALVAALLGAMVLSAVAALILAFTGRGGRILVTVLAGLAGALGLNLLLSVDSLGARVIGGLVLAAAIVSLVRVWRPGPA